MQHNANFTSLQQGTNVFREDFNNGKSFGGCCKAFTLLSTFSNYRMIIARQTYSDLKKTTMQTFFKICPAGIIQRHNEQDGYTEFINKSVIHWLHLDKVDESTLRGLEINSALIDQAEEIEEKVFDVLDGRIGRWDDAEVPVDLLEKYPDWPRNKTTGKLLAPSYHMLLCNPDSQFHFIFRKFHPDSLERRPAFFYTEGEWDPNLGSSETYAEAITHDAEWVNKYVKGQWGISSAQIHRLFGESQLNYTPELVEKILRKGIYLECWIMVTPVLLAVSGLLSWMESIFVIVSTTCLIGLYLITVKQSRR